jgi:hypothetical protein
MVIILLGGSMMTRLFSLALFLLGSVTANAATVTITFDDPATETYWTFDDPYSGGTVDVVEKEGFDVLASGLGGTSDDRNATGYFITLDGYYADMPVSIYRVDGGAFTLHSFDAEGLSNFDYRLADGGGGSASDLAQLPGGVLSNVTRVDFNAHRGIYDLVSIDNIVVSAVPVPAAIWLFGSGLGLLGWFRRRQTA